MKKLLTIAPLLLLSGCQGSTPTASSKPVRVASIGTTMPKPPVVKDDFADLSSVTFVVSGGLAGGTDSLIIADGHITRMTNRPVSTMAAAFTKSDMKQLATVLEKADFTKLDGDYHQNNLDDGLNERVSAVVGTGRGARVYVVTNYGNKAPAAYFKVTEYLRKLQKTKFPLGQ